MAAAAPASAVTFDDGLVHVIDAANSFPLETVFVGPSTTTVIVVAGGEISTREGVGIFASGTAVVNMSGGIVDSRVLFTDPFLPLLRTP